MSFISTFEVFIIFVNRIKWPNDVYYGREVKLGGTMTTADCIGEDVMVEIGTGVNIANSVPTTCVNDIISEYNKNNGTTLAPISVEKFLARYCSHLERILEMLDDDAGVESFLELYYQYWMHSGEEIKVKSSEDGSPVQGTISGLDSSGWLLVDTPGGRVRVAPDGNTFDIMSGLIAPKF
ncbi:unnamed protein product [Euphydryas editha]|uniref:BPL/LPL catalytic domain-containing protein n=1 Tax=Euphydryas editha TaxID=104508 RepID=A0AAU9UBJ7_EUPED|nr:unnamed protein product [Euphydryas editha]